MFAKVIRVRQQEAINMDTTYLLLPFVLVIVQQTSGKFLSSFTFTRFLFSLLYKKLRIASRMSLVENILFIVFMANCHLGSPALHMRISMVPGGQMHYKCIVSSAFCPPGTS
jgi:biotin transporter BioY